MKKMKNDLCTIYIITNVINNKIYIGQTWSNINHRLSQHLSDKEAKCPYLFNAISKYNKNNFNIKPLYICNNQEEANILENYYIIKFNSRNRDFGYNLKEGGSFGKHSDETKQKLSSDRMGEKNPMFGKKSHLLNKKRSKENIEKQVLTNKKRIRTWKTINGKRIWTIIERDIIEMNNVK